MYLYRVSRQITDIAKNLLIRKKSRNFQFDEFLNKISNSHFSKFDWHFNPELVGTPGSMSKNRMQETIFGTKIQILLVIV